MDEDYNLDLNIDITDGNGITIHDVLTLNNKIELYYPAN